LFAVLATTGCWEQWSEKWFSQMKWQKAAQAFERVEWNDQVVGFLAPEGSAPVNAAPPVYGRLDLAGLDELRHPTNPGTLRSIARGQELYRVYCIVCHGERGMGDGRVSHAGPEQGPFGEVWSVTTASAKSDGYIYNVIRVGNGGRLGYRMPSYKRIPDMDRWHLVDYVRHLQRRGQP
jgi:mono/diheme cytochrome c family protein